MGAFENGCKSVEEPEVTCTSRGLAAVASSDPARLAGQLDLEASWIIGSVMPSGELLAAAAEMTEALRWWDAELEVDDDLLIDPHWPPPAVVAEAASANEAKRFEEVRGKKENVLLLSTSCSRSPLDMFRRFGHVSNN